MGLLFFYITLAPVELFPFTSPNETKRTCRICSKRKTTASLMEEDFVPETCQHAKLEKKAFILENVDSTMNFHFLIDYKTIRHIKSSRTLFILRGLPGSGKSTIVRNIQRVYPNSVTCSADDHFLVEGTYRFDVAGLKDAHSECQKKARQACESGVPVVIIDNTNVRHWEMKFYFSIARQAGYTVVITECRTPWRFNPQELAKRNKHGVEEEVLRTKVSQFENLSPVYFGWFLSEKGSRDLMSVAKVLFSECLKYCPDFCRLLKIDLDASMTKGRSPSPYVSEEKVLSIFQWSTSTCILHCTAKFCNKGRAPGAQEYLHREDVKESVGKGSVLQIVGFTFSRDTVGARVQLNTDQLSLFDKPEETEHDEVLARNAAVKSRVAQMKNPYKSKPLAKLGERSLQLIDSVVDDKTMDSCSLHPATIPPPQGFGRSAHVTICCAEGVKPSQVIYDLLDICDIETLEKESLNFFPVMGGKAAFMRDGFCTVYLYKPITVSSLFSAYYV